MNLLLKYFLKIAESVIAIKVEVLLYITVVS